MKVEKEMTRAGRRLIEDFLLPALNDGRYGDRLKWVDKDNLYFSIKWSHKNAAKWSLEDTVVFQDWDRMKGHFHPEIKGYYMQAKQRFRAALYKLNTVRKIRSTDKQTKLYQLVFDNDKKKNYLDPVYQMIAPIPEESKDIKLREGIPTSVIRINENYINTKRPIIAKIDHQYAAQEGIKNKSPTPTENLLMFDDSTSTTSNSSTDSSAGNVINNTNGESMVIAIKSAPLGLKTEPLSTPTSVPVERPIPPPPLIICHPSASMSCSSAVVSHRSSANVVVAHKSSANVVVAHKSTVPTMVAHKSTAPAVVAHKSSAPAVVAHKSSAPTVVAHKSLAPTVVAHKSSAFTMDAHKNSASVMVAQHYSVPAIFSRPSCGTTMISHTHLSSSGINRPSTVVFRPPPPASSATKVSRKVFSRPHHQRHIPVQVLPQSPRSGSCYLQSNMQLNPLYPLTVQVAKKQQLEAAEKVPMECSEGALNLSKKSVDFESLPSISVSTR